MRKTRFLNWNDWQNGIELYLKIGFKNVLLTGSRINGALTTKNINIKKPSQEMGNIPFVETTLTNVIAGWDDESSGSPDYEGHEYNKTGGTTYIDSTNFLRERIVFTINAVTQKYEDAIEISNTLRRMFGIFNTIEISMKDNSYQAFSKLDNYNIGALEDADGHVEYFTSSWDLTLSIKTDLNEQDVKSKNIVSINMDLVASDGINDSEELEKNLES